MKEDVHHGTDLLHLGISEAETVQSLIMAYKPVKKRVSPMEMNILLTDENPVYERPRRMSYANRKAVDGQVAVWLGEGIIQVSNSNYASRIVRVGKKDGSTKSSPFKILTGLEMRVVGTPQMQELLENEAIDEMDAEREEVRRQARENIVVVQDENRRTFNANRRTESKYVIDELVVIKRTQYGVGLKLKPKYLGPYKIMKKMRRGRYIVEKVGDNEGPDRSTTVADFMKRWDPSFEPRVDNRTNTDNNVTQQKDCDHHT